MDVNQTATDCSQDQTRTAQDQEVETISGIVRDKGEPYTQSRTITVSSTRDSVGTLDPWEQFAQEKGLSNTWYDLQWQSKGLSDIPNSPYPITSANNLYLTGNQLTNVDGLSNLTSVSTLYLNNNQLTNVNGLSNLTSVSNNLYLNNNQLTNVDGLSNLTSANTLYLNNNQLTNVDGLSNLTSVGRLSLDSNQLTNVDGLANVRVSAWIRVDATYSGPKLAANTRFCTLNINSVFPSGYAQKSKLCESP